MSDLCNPTDCSPLGSSVHGIFQARILEWFSIPFSRESSWPRDWTHVSYVSSIGSGGFFTAIATWEAPVWPITSSNQQGDTQCFLATQISYMALHNQGTTSHHLCYVLMVRTKGRDNTWIQVTRIMGESVKNQWFFMWPKCFLELARF